MAYQGFGEYMALKAAKQQKQNSTDTKWQLQSEVLRPVTLWFDGIHNINTATYNHTNNNSNNSDNGNPNNLSALDLKALCLSHAATVCDSLSLRVSHIIALSLTERKMDLWRNRRVVHPDWLLQSIAKAKLLPWQQFGLIQRANASLFNTKALVSIEHESKLLQQQPQQQHQHQQPPQQKHPRIHSTSAKNPSNPTPRESTEWAAKNVATASGFLEKYYGSSRLSKISNWKSDLKEFVLELDLTYPKVKPPSTTIKSKTSHSSTIMHVDMDCFFASVALRDRPEIQHLPVAICHSKGTGNSGNNTGISDFTSTSEIASCNYVARSYGVKNGMFLGTAQKLVASFQGQQQQHSMRLITLPYEFEKYDSVSRSLYTILHTVSDELMVVSCDEAYIDVSSQVIHPGSGREIEIAEQIRESIRCESGGCRASIGIGESMLTARVATKKAKPDGVYHISSESAAFEFSKLGVQDLPGVGYALTKQMAGLGINSCGDLMKLSLTECKKRFGEANGLKLHQFCRGIDKRPLENKARQSIGAEVNWGVRFQSITEVHAFLSELSQEVHTRLNKTGLVGNHVTLKVKKKLYDGEPAKFLGCGECVDLSKSKTIDGAANVGIDLDVLVREVLMLYRDISVAPEDLRGVGIHIGKLTAKSAAMKGRQKTLLNFGVKRSADAAGLLSNHIGNGYNREEVNEEELEPRRKILRNSNNPWAVDDLPVIPLQPAISSSSTLVFPSSSQIDWSMVEHLPRDIREELFALRKKSTKNAGSSSSTFAVASSNHPQNRQLNSKQTYQHASTGAPSDYSKNLKRVSDEPPSLIGKTAFSDVNCLLKQWIKASSSPLTRTDTDLVRIYFRALVQNWEGEKCLCLLKTIVDAVEEYHGKRERKGKQAVCNEGWLYDRGDWKHVVDLLTKDVNDEFLVCYGGNFKKH
ncbi:deoxycytidyl transferase [Physocladia obscura]|uniref:DNA repair protein REV1 n=1 Tax=Physocladia obscura TaxID=109957 RepID=A0AAD5SWS8_9FUNG|nr:deoxycytidyl transferase [Physocladia obscura]